MSITAVAVGIFAAASIILLVLWTVAGSIWFFEHFLDKKLSNDDKPNYELTRLGKGQLFLVLLIGGPVVWIIVPFTILSKKLRPMERVHRYLSL